MASLNGQTIASSYEQLLHTDTDGGGNGNTLVTIKDGDNGTTFGLKLATNKVEVIPGSNDANAFEVSLADGTALFTLNTSTPGGTLVSDEENILRLDGLQGNIDFRYGSDIEFDRAGQVYITANNGSGELNFRTGGQNTAMHIDSSQQVGIGTTSPDNNMHIASTSSETGMIIQSNLGGTGSAIGGQIKLALGARNNSGSGQADTQAGDVLGQIMFEGQGTDFSYQGGNIKTIVTTGDGNDNRSNQETAMTFETIAVGSVSPAEQLRLTGDGDLGLGDNSPSTALTSFGSASRGLSIKNVQPTIALTDTDATGHFWIANVGGQSYFQNNVSGSIFRFLTSDGEKLRILNGGGITFNGDTAAANALDDYEEGTWTPQLANAASGGTLAGTSTAVARYTKIGDKVHIQGYVVCNSQSGISGSAFVYLRNIPYVSHSTSNLYSAGTIGYAQGLDITATGHISLNLDHNGSAYAALNSWDVSTGTSQLTFDELSTDGGFIFQMTYVTN